MLKRHLPDDYFFVLDKAIMLHEVKGGRLPISDSYSLSRACYQSQSSKHEEAWLDEMIELGKMAGPLEPVVATMSPLVPNWLSPLHCLKCVCVWQCFSLFS